MTRLPDRRSPCRIDTDKAGRRHHCSRQHADLERGVHPFTRGRTHPELGTCGQCLHRISLGGHAKSYPKCDAFGRRSMTSSAATDIRASWPACERFEAAS